MIVYHGSTEQILHPDIKHSKKYLDFGRGFYVTTYRQQAEKWAGRKAVRTGRKPIINVYQLPDAWDGFRVLEFHGADEECLDFVCASRQGKELYKAYDVIIGNVADDDVFKTVDMYLRRIWEKERALEELRYFRKNDQICITSESAIERVVFLESYQAEV
ncbi:MAG: DUF3990 domain-containing protein [Lachnospiraceae bacterium]|nr:DUF3990 domain-containing protein [Lachnospiraceae bacterium]